LIWTETGADVAVVTLNVYDEVAKIVWAKVKVPVAESMLKIPPPFPDTIAQVPVDWPVSIPTNAPLVALFNGR
jgi:hypothetical protein